MFDYTREHENDFSFWYPKIKDCGIPTPLTFYTKLPSVEEEPEYERERIEGAFKSEKDRVQAMVETAMKRVTGLAGQWSVDILMDEGDNLWLIDMAIAQRSAYWEKRPEGYAE